MAATFGDSAMGRGMPACNNSALDIILRRIVNCQRSRDIGGWYISAGIGVFYIRRGGGIYACATCETTFRFSCLPGAISPRSPTHPGEPSNHQYQLIPFRCILNKQKQYGNHVQVQYTWLKSNATWFDLQLSWRHEATRVVPPSLKCKSYKMNF